MRNTIKTLILFLAIILAIGGVFIYASTRIEPPKIPIEYNQYNVDLSKNYKILSTTEDELKIEAMYTMLKDRIDIYESESKITADEKDKSLKDFMNVYTTQFTNFSFSKFVKSDWNNNNHKNIVIRVDELKNIRLSNNTQVLKKSTVDSLNLINKIIRDYNHAWTVAQNTTFTTVANAHIAKENVSKYINDRYLSNCTSLNTSLRGVMGKVGESHRNQVNYRISQLGVYKNSNQTYYLDNLVPSFDRVFREYKENANSLYGGGFGTTSETSSLFAKAERLMEDALVYYSLN